MKRLGDRRAGILAVLFLVTASIFISQAGTVTIDLPFTGVTLGGLLYLTIWQQPRDKKWLILAGFLIGYNCGIRHTGYIVMLLCFFGVLLESRSTRSALILITISIVAASPWFIRSYFVIENPVYPLLGSIFEDRVFARHQATEIGQHETIKETSALGFIKYHWI